MFQTRSPYNSIIHIFCVLSIYGIVFALKIGQGQILLVNQQADSVLDSSYFYDIGVKSQKCVHACMLSILTL